MGGNSVNQTMAQIYLSPLDCKKTIRVEENCSYEKHGLTVILCSVFVFKQDTAKVSQFITVRNGDTKIVKGIKMTKK